jgi:ribonuclease M5
MIIVVEGKNDYSKIKTVFPKANVLITNGSAVDDEFLEMLKIAAIDNEIILCLDPDYAGERIRRKIMEVIPQALHVFADPKISRSKNGKKIGIEHMSKDDIKALFNHIITPTKKAKLTKIDMLDLGLSGDINSREARKAIGLKLNIGYANAKQFLMRLNMINISIEELRRLYDSQSNKTNIKQI